ncbi:class I SAM-dependent methyltransferase [Anabaena cylindrica FACHB-243]|uniref:Methyltransferase type 11 n=1 Tax=Anabaena cylindrica (strain ATCC 27899 / PCC 7122) TaxID=272123 RepID=K9ZNY5_ANACC|nr:MULTISPECIES: methyltransferase domain-containing protein [Anabaena]AFZ60045.1 Methyltransferase type 11 [Anabaena cylindrica PCC 7122]MBD2417897.1 class I SAM-dependent methyltransferase [Anabaena cylindrica FACHB-243]MBY5282522.1 class I SAM-dependent methyltransferase [Anabaena sp. CCAP 1446/1C]MBY5307459.1 class I SAM-dependent methyltransferase [Anabaena sp. CCAP 1446/1C]MCM2404813.1 class I SAM-dependent methyltransferase [Anabaena sp. CCAP 1446/1C]
MATILRDWSYRYQWLYDGISRLAALSVGGEGRFRQLALQGLTLNSDTQVLDLCCGSGQTTEFLVKLSQNVTGLDASPLSLQRARRNVPNATYIEAFAENMPFADHLFDVIHTSAALHEMQPEQLRKIIQEVYRVLKPGGVFTLVDFHSPTNPIFWPGLSVFFWLFETETAWELLKTDLPALLTENGFEVGEPSLYAGGSLQVIQAQKLS